MKGNKKVIDALNMLLTGELSAADQYFVHSRMYHDWGLNELYERLKHEQEEELEHAARLVERILFLEGTPDVASREALRIGKDVPSMMKNDLVYELEVGANLKKVIALCEKEQDYVSRELLVSLLEDTEEDHTYWLEKQLGLIDKMGLENYVQSKMGSGDPT
ncbi:bacterioferritin [Aestuariispira insulae]|uniref:Bacterioferritin n=1 Tax=Aestuariispira insulae TaxID=1461337 RepID=A0A3D9HJY9_9PROT|nr:bacterioferritin [Aestuariispira insulae]RED49236.1 bacterioferritin [Aestuariispira insulae]